MRISNRSAIDSFIVMDVMEAARAAEVKGNDIIHMEVGQPATGAPRRAQEAVQRAMGEGALGYTVALGLPALRERIAKMYQDRYGVSVSAERIVITEGASAGFILAFLALFDAGDHVAIADPGYPSYRNILKALDLVPKRIEGTLANSFQPCVEDISADLAGLLLASPANPTGSMLGRLQFKALAERAAELGVTLISDEIYQGISFGAESVTALEIAEDAIVLNSFSKYYSMTGWRIGWMVVPEALLHRIERLAQNLFICAPHVSQIAALAALDAEEELESHVAAYARNRAVLLDALPDLGFSNIAPPDGAFYIYADISRWSDDSLAFCARTLSEAGIAITPGLDFDPIRGTQTVRFSYAGAPKHIEEAVKRLKGWLPKF